MRKTNAVSKQLVDFLQMLKCQEDMARPIAMPTLTT